MSALFERIKNLFAGIFNKKRKATPVPDAKKPFSAPVYERGKEDKHTKTKRLMTMKSRRINRLYEQRTKARS